MSFMDLLASRKAKLGGKYLLPADDLQPLVEAETAADMGEEEVDMAELREEEMVNKVNEEEVRRHSKSVKISTSALFAQKNSTKTRKPVGYKIRDKTP